jgi:hypothetical protein
MRPPRLKSWMKAAPNLPMAAVVSPLAWAAWSIVDTSVSLPW